MTAFHPASLRTQTLRDLGVSYPFWVFDVDHTPRPRKLSEIPAGARPARITGWLPWGWEYGTTLWRIDDPLPAHVIDTRDRHPRLLGSVQGLLDRLRYDDGFAPDTFVVRYEGGGGAGAGDDGGGGGGGRGEESRMSGDRALLSKPFEDWVFDPEVEGYVAPRRIVRIERRWDDVPMWDREAGLNLFDGLKGFFNGCYGAAVFVHNDAEFLAAVGMETREEKIRKAEFDLCGDETETVRGIVYPGRSYGGNGDRGLILSRGPQFPWNREVLKGTALEGAPWSEVEEYVMCKRPGPLW